MEIIEQPDEWRRHYDGWKRQHRANNDDIGDSYPFVKNRRAPFSPARRALPMINLALISSAGAYIDGTQPFDTSASDGDLTFREIPSEIEPEDIRFAGRDYDQTAVESDINSQVPLTRLFEFEGNGIIGQFNPVFWSFCGFIPDAGRVLDELVPALVERVNLNEVQAALLIPASPLCHQTISLVARGLELNGIPTMTLAVLQDVVASVRPPRAAVYAGESGSVAGLPNYPEHQRRILDEALRLIEPMDQPGVRKLNVEQQSSVEVARGER